MYMLSRIRVLLFMWVQCKHTCRPSSQFSRLGTCVSVLSILFVHVLYGCTCICSLLDLSFLPFFSSSATTLATCTCTCVCSVLYTCVFMHVHVYTMYMYMYMHFCLQKCTTWWGNAWCFSLVRGRLMQLKLNYYWRLIQHTFAAKVFWSLAVKGGDRVQSS